ncbi:MAG: shikimate dehydrogenase [Nocardioidaceae bacterium]|nr:shikimate dehydrogenase [Nocardioidaceae bacterium]
MLTRRCAVLGTPVAHSLSPVLHRAAYAELGLDWEYGAQELATDALPGFLAGLDETWRGLSLTMPLKRAVLPLLDEVSDRAERAGAANTVVLEDGRRSGDNTDIPGAVAAVRERYDGPLRRALVVGGGATATSIVHALADLGCDRVTLLVRDVSRAAPTVAAAARHLRPPAVDVRLLETGPVPADLLVCTIPGGGQTDQVLALADAAPVVFDVAYDPWPTRLAAHTAASGRRLVSGLDLLVHQAALQVHLMTGTPGPVAVMRAAGEAELARRAWSTGAAEPPRGEAGNG